MELKKWTVLFVLVSGLVHAEVSYEGNTVRAQATDVVEVDCSIDGARIEVNYWLSNGDTSLSERFRPNDMFNSREEYSLILLAASYDDPKKIEELFAKYCDRFAKKILTAFHKDPNQYVIFQRYENDTRVKKIFLQQPSLIDRTKTMLSTFKESMTNWIESLRTPAKK